MADACDYRPTQLMGNAGAAATLAVGAAPVSISSSMGAAGYYTLVHSTGGYVMFGSVAAGTSGAGTVGIIAGSQGLAASIVAFLSGPIVIGTGIVLTVASSGYEGVCFFADERITDYEEVYAAMQLVASTSDPELFSILEGRVEGETALLHMQDPGGQIIIYDIDNLYIVNGTVMHRDWFRNTTVGFMAIVSSDGAARLDTIEN